MLFGGRDRDVEMATADLIGFLKGQVGDQIVEALADILGRETLLIGVTACLLYTSRCV